MDQYSTSDIAQRLGSRAEAVCRHYLSNGRREGRHWLVGDMRNTPGRSLYVRLVDMDKARKVTHVAFRPDWNRFKKAAPFRRNDQMLDTLPKAVIACPGNGINANLGDKARKMGITVWKVRK